MNNQRIILRSALSFKIRSTAAPLVASAARPYTVSVGIAVKPPRFNISAAITISLSLLPFNRFVSIVISSFCLLLFLETQWSFQSLRLCLR